MKTYSYRCDRGYYMADRYIHGWCISRQKEDLNWEPVFKCKTGKQAVECLGQLWDHDGTIYINGYGKTMSDAVELILSR